MIGEYPNSWGIGILDQQNELQIGVKFPDKNVITLVENAKRNLAQCFAYLLKTSRDVLVVSEITLPEEVSELVNSALRLNAGVSATMHSFSPKEVIPNLRNLMMKTPMYHDKNTAEEDIASCKVAAIDPYFLEETQKVAELCVKLGKPFVTIDCRHEHL